MPTTVPRYGVPGERIQDTLVSDAPLLAGWAWPYTTIVGREGGPLATIIAGIHGCEYVSIRAAMRLAAELDPATVRGRILIVPVVNLPAFRDRTPFVCPLDGKNPNRVFPGDPAGTFSEVLADFIFTTCIAPGEAFFDLHGGDMVEDLEPFAILAADAAPEVVARSRALAEAFGLPYTINQRNPPGQRSGMSFAAAAAAGIPGLIAEAGGIGQLTEPDVELLVNGTRRALRVAGNLADGAARPGTRYLEEFSWLYTTQGGFWVSAVRAGEDICAGQVIGQLYGLHGDPIETIVAPTDGVVLFRTTSAAVGPNGLVVGLGDWPRGAEWA
jgi:predicted deacylase